MAAHQIPLATFFCVSMYGGTARGIGTYLERFWVKIPDYFCLSTYQLPRVDDAPARGGDGSGATACASPASRRGMFRVRSCPLNVQAGFRFSLELRENIINHNGWSGTPECRAQYALQVDAMARENVHMLKS